MNEIIVPLFAGFPSNAIVRDNALAVNSTMLIGPGRLNQVREERLGQRAQAMHWWWRLAAKHFLHAGLAQPKCPNRQNKA